jgi:hypothetical protein
VRFTDIESSCNSKSESQPGNYATVSLRGRGLGVGGIHPLSFRQSLRVWVPAFAGKTGCGVGKENKALTQPSPTGRGLEPTCPSPLRGRGLGVGVFIPSLPAGVKGSGSSPARGTRKKENKTPYGPSGHFPQRGKINDSEIFPLWGKYRRSRGRGSFITPQKHLAFSPPRFNLTN